MAQDLELPTKPREKSPWSMTKLFPFASAVSTVTKQFTSPFDILLGFSILVAGIIEVTGNHASWLLYVVIILLVIGALFERNVDKFIPPREDKK